MKKLMSKKKGFTLVELLVVVAIIAILMLLALPKFLDSTKGAKIKTFEGNVRTVMSQIVQYSADNGGGYTGIDGDSSPVKKFVASLAGKPADAVYHLDTNSFKAKLSVGDTATDVYLIEYVYKTGEVKSSAPTGYKTPLKNADGNPTAPTAQTTVTTGTTAP